jgi:hypothetical protein
MDVVNPAGVLWRQWVRGQPSVSFRCKVGLSFDQEVKARVGGSEGFEKGWRNAEAQKARLTTSSTTREST